MTPLQIARLHCANYEGDGSCLGIMLSKDLAPVRTMRHEKCKVGTPGVRCLYFEESVLPMNRADWPELQPPKQHADFAEAARTYEVVANVPSQRSRGGRKCACGRELEPRRRMCCECRLEARRRATSVAVQKHRSDVSS